MQVNGTNTGVWHGYDTQRKAVTEETDAKRFEGLALPHLDAVYNLARWLSGNDKDAHAITREAYSHAFRVFSGFRGDDARAWMLMIVRNAYGTWLKKNRPGAEAVSFVEEPHIPGEADQEISVRIFGSHSELGAMRPSRREIVESALESLSRETREIIVLRELEDLSYKKIAEIVDVPVETVMSRLSRARRQLRERLEQTDVELPMLNCHDARARVHAGIDGELKQSRIIATEFHCKAYVGCRVIHSRGGS